jgi:hypothetical protein
MLVSDVTSIVSRVELSSSSSLLELKVVIVVILIL